MGITYRIFPLFILVVLFSCEKPRENKSVVFETLEASKTGLNFINKLTPTEDFNMFHYMYFYNGAGVGGGDFNNDGKIDLFFASNQGENKLFLNTGGLQFRDATKEAQIPQDNAWSTGVSVVDINNDGLLDIYVCRVGNYEVLRGKNQLLVCTGIKEGIPQYNDKAAEYGLDFSGFSTQAAFLDYDLDGDLDMFLLNHTVHQNGSFAPRKNLLGTYDALSGDRLYRNDGNRFTDITRIGKINSTAIGYGLGIAVADINLDGWPDLYIGNDFHEDDYLYINQKDGSFADENRQRLMHTSQFSMGVDIGDVTNDGFPEIISMDMLPADPQILKSSSVDNDYDIFYNKISIGYSYQYSRNNLQYNRKNGMFSETGFYSGVYATDWSWAPLWMDFDNDGLKDLFISNGIPKRLNDMDYINFVSNEQIQNMIRDKQDSKKNIQLVSKFPDTKIPNRFFRNAGGLKFEDFTDSVGSNHPTYSNGAVYADLDNDGDLDVVVNNIDEAPLVYRNTNNDSQNRTFVQLTLKGPSTNVNALGAKVFVFANGEIRSYEKSAVKGFQSSMEQPMHIGMNNSKIDSAFLVWPDNSFQPVSLTNKSRDTITYQKGLKQFDYQTITGFEKRKVQTVIDVTANSGLTYLHQENRFQEFDREPLMPQMLSTEGPALAVSDINGDGLEDVFLGSARGFRNAVFLQQAGGKFVRTVQPALEQDSIYEEVDATFADVNNDGKVDLVVAGGGNEFFGPDKRLLPRVYLNDGNGTFNKLEDAFHNIFVTASCIKALDFDKDGFVDLFIGARTVPWNYGQSPRSYLLRNDGTGRFRDVTEQNAKELATAGMVDQAEWVDLDSDGDSDLVICLQWGTIDAFINSSGRFDRRTLTSKKGWWNFVLPVDINNDGKMDLVAGNLGLNSRLKASEKEPVRLYYTDVDDNGKKEQVITFYSNGKEIPFSNKNELEKQIPVLRKKFLYASEFAKATVPEIFTEEKLEGAEILSADHFANSILINTGNLNFTMMDLPWEAQLTSYRDAVVVNANGDNLPDILLVGNFYQNAIQMGRNDADFGTLLINKGNNEFHYASLGDVILKGQYRHIERIKLGKADAFVVAGNNDSTRVLQFK